MRRILPSLASLAVMLCAMQPAAAKDDDKSVVLEPSSAWQLNYSDDSCRLSRAFGEGKKQTIVYFERYRPSDDFMLVVAGGALPTSLRRKLAFRFGPYAENEWREREVGVGNLGKFEPALLFSSTSLIPIDGKPEDANFARDFDPELDAALALKTAVEPLVEEAIEWLDVKVSRKAPIRFKLGSMGEPLAAMRTCTDELVTHWGIDAVAHKALTQPVIPVSNPGYWLRPRDYPSDMLRRGMQGIVKFRLSVDAEGRPTRCHIQKSTRPAEFDDAVCRGIMKRAEFKPALDKDGNPIASYWHSSVRFKLD